MKSPKERSNSTDQPIISSSKREIKKNVNISWNSGLFVQIGMIISLLLVLWVVESSWGLSSNKMSTVYEFTLEEPGVEIYIIEDVKVVNNQKKKPFQETDKNFTDPTIGITAVGNHTKNKESDTRPTDGTRSNPDTPVRNVSVKRNVLNVEFVPVYPGCETHLTNKEKVFCMSTKIGSYINRNFNVDKFIEKDLYGVQRIYVQFKIDLNGKVTDIKARASDKELESEAMRVLKDLPEMTPGKQGNTNVDVMYSIPIILKIDY